MQNWSANAPSTSPVAESTSGMCGQGLTQFQDNHSWWRCEDIWANNCFVSVPLLLVWSPEAWSRAAVCSSSNKWIWKQQTDATSRQYLDLLSANGCPYTAKHAEMGLQKLTVQNTTKCLLTTDLPCDSSTGITLALLWQAGSAGEALPSHSAAAQTDPGEQPSCQWDWHKARPFWPAPRNMFSISIDLMQNNSHIIEALRLRGEQKDDVQFV